MRDRLKSQKELQREERAKQSTKQPKDKCDLFVERVTKQLKELKDSESSDE